MCMKPVAQPVRTGSDRGLGRAQYKPVAGKFRIVGKVIAGREVSSPSMNDRDGGTNSAGTVHSCAQSFEFLQQIQRQGGTGEVDAQVTLQAQGTTDPAHTGRAEPPA